MKNDLTVEDVSLKIDKEFESRLPIHSKQELADLSALIHKDGKFIQSIIYWEEERIIVDGHGRYKVWMSLPEDTTIPPPPIEAKSFANRAEARLWMAENQLSRRNMTPKQLSLLRKEVCDAMKSAHGGDRKSSGNFCHNEGAEPIKQGEKSRDAAAKRTGVSPRTIQNDIKFGDALEAIGRVNKKFEMDVRSGVISPSTKDVINVSQLPREYQGKGMANIRNKREWNHGIEQTNGKPKKPEKPEQIKLLEQSERLINSASDAYYNAYNIDSSVDRAGYDKIVSGLIEFLNKQKRLASARCG